MIRMMSGSMIAGALALATMASMATKAHAEGGWTRPWQLMASGTSILDFGPEAAERGCAPGDPLIVIQGAGRQSYLGVVDVEQSHCQNLATGHLYNGEYTGTGADGVSQTFGTYEAQLVPTVRCPNPAVGQCVFRIEGTWQTTGGTGSMAGVIGGSGVARGTLDLSSGMSVAFLEGDIVARGALRGEF